VTAVCCHCHLRLEQVLAGWIQSGSAFDDRKKDDLCIYLFIYLPIQEPSGYMMIITLMKVKLASRHKGVWGEWTYSSIFS
jgi:hypothetical protein